MKIYSATVVQNYWKKIQDGTLWTLDRLRKSGQARTHLYKAEDSNFLHILPNITRTKSLDEHMTLVRDEVAWEEFERDRLDPCFLYEVNFHPFETPVFESDAHAADPLDEPEKRGPHAALRHGPANDNAEVESSMSPAQIIELSLAKIEHRFPGGENGEFGDKDVRDLIAAQTYVFQNNYDTLNRRRRANVQLWMRLALGLIVVWTWWVLETFSATGIRPLHAMFDAVQAYAGIDLKSARLLVRAVFSPWVFAGLTLGAFVGALAWAKHIHGLQRLRFVASTRASSATVSKSVTSRLENILYVSRALIEEIDRGKDDAWDQGTLKPWATATQKLVQLVFWSDQRIYAIEETLRIHMKLIGLCNDGIRDDAKFKALLLIYRHATLACLLPVAAWLINTHLLGWRAAGVTSWPTVAGYALCLTGFFALLLRLHSLVKGQEPPESIYNLISYAATKTMKSYRDSQLYKELAAFITREKRRLLREEEKRRA